MDAARQAKESTRAYLEAELGFRNHWYPATFRSELEDGEAKPVTLLGEPFLLRLVDGKVCAVEDRCGHRRVRFSAKLECYTRDTVTCWYHGFTYRFTDGALVQVLTDPECPLIGKMSLRTIPVAEAQGIVFLFVGDGEPPPIYIHRDSGVVTKTDAVLPLGFVPQDKHAMEIVDGPSGPKGIVDKLWLSYVPVFQAPIDDTIVSAVLKETEKRKLKAAR